MWEVLPVEPLREGGTLVFSKNLKATVISGVLGTPFYILKFSLHTIQLWNEIYKIGEPIRYEYIHEPWPLDDYQTVYGSIPGSVEMPSAGRAFSWELLMTLQKKGVKVAYLQLHTGLSYLLDDKWDRGPEQNIETYHIPEETQTLISEAKRIGKKVVAVGTTVVRALESAEFNQPEPRQQWCSTSLHIDKDFKLKTVDGLLTGFHEPEASHLDLLTAFIEEKKLEKAYHSALRERYLWHEFGDMNLIFYGAVGCL